MKNDFLMQFQSDILHVPVERPVVNETTALGAAYLAGLATGFWSSQEEISNQWAIETCFEPNMADETRVDLYNGWKRAVKAAIAFK